MFEEIKHHKKIGLLFTGGADSALLGYLLLKHTNAKIYPICYDIIEKPFQKNKAHDVLNQIEMLMGDRFEPITISKPIYMDQMLTDDNILLYDLYKNEKIQCHVKGTTANPPKGFYVEDLSHPTRPHDRDLEGMTRTISSSYKFKDVTMMRYSPFFNKDKKYIHQLYKQNGILNTLFPTTVSCTYQPYNCGTCWWCEERKWGFGRV